VTKGIEREIHALQERTRTIDVYEKAELIEEIDPKDRYLTEPAHQGRRRAIKKSGIRIAIDSLYGTARDYLDTSSSRAASRSRSSTTTATRTSAASPRVQ